MYTLVQFFSVRPKCVTGLGVHVLQVCGPCNVHVCAHTAQRWQLVVSVPGSSSSGRVIVISNYQITHVCVLYSTSKVCITNTKQSNIEQGNKEKTEKV